MLFSEVWFITDSKQIAKGRVIGFNSYDDDFYRVKTRNQGRGRQRGSVIDIHKSRVFPITTNYNMLKLLYSGGK